MTYSYADSGAPEAIAEIEDFYDRWAETVNTKVLEDPDAGLAFYARPVRMFDFGDREVTDDFFVEHFRRIAPFFANAKFDISDREITVDGNLAFVAMFQRVTGTDPGGNDFDLTLRVTECLRKVDGDWKFVHAHGSFPVDMRTGQADFTSAALASGTMIEQTMGADADARGAA